MAPKDRVRLVLAMVAIAGGTLAALLPLQWIEGLTEVAPDGGDGLLEVLFVIIPIAGGVVLAASVFLAERRLPWQPRRASDGPTDQP